MLIFCVGLIGMSKLSNYSMHTIYNMLMMHFVKSMMWLTRVWYSMLGVPSEVCTHVNTVHTRQLNVYYIFNHYIIIHDIMYMI